MVAKVHWLEITDVTAPVLQAYILKQLIMQECILPHGGPIFVFGQDN